MATYRHLTLEEREWIFHYRQEGYSDREIGKLIRRHHTTIGREVKRNAPYLQRYVACRAHTKAVNRAIKCRRVAALKSPEIFLYVREKIRLGWSPECVAGRLKLDHPGCSIHFETIYRYIYKKENRMYRLWEHLTLGHKKRREKTGRSIRKHGRIPGAISIESRPKEVELRLGFGHWETDNMEGPRGTKTALSATLERWSRYMVLTKVMDKTADAKLNAVVTGLKPYLVATITADNGKENSFHVEMSEELGADVYFCHSYASWEKGSVENGIKRVRVYLPKGTSLRNVSQARIRQIQDQMNNRPMKCLGWLSPRERMDQLRACPQTSSGNK